MIILKDREEPHPSGCGVDLQCHVF